MKAIIVGAGIAGLVAARQLGLAGWEVLVLERAAVPRPDGYMMDFFGPGVEASKRIGLYPYLVAAAYRIDAAEYLDPRGRRTARLDYRKFSALAGGKVLTLLRPDMEEAARTALRDVAEGLVELRYGVRIERMAVEGRGVLVQAAGWARPEAADLLIGADGIHSAVRERFFGPEERFLRPLGMRAAAFIVPEPELNRQFANRFALSDTVDRTAGIYGLHTGEVAAFLVYRHLAHAPLGETRQRLRRAFAGTGTQVDRLLQLCPPEPYDDAVAQVVMPRWNEGPVVLIGDAAGAVSLLAGQGGAMAVCAAAALGDALGPVPDPDRMGAALEGFERALRPAITTAQASGRRAAGSFLPRTRRALLLRRLIIRATVLPGVDRLVARQIIRRLAT